MRRAVLILTCAISSMWLLCFLALPIAWLGEANTLVLPDAADLRVEWLSPARQQLTYRLPPSRALSDLYRHLEEHGWTRDARAEQIFRRDGTEDLGGAFAVYSGRGWLGLVPEVATIVASPGDVPLIEIRLARCFALTPWAECL